MMGDENKDSPNAASTSRQGDDIGDASSGETGDRQPFPENEKDSEMEIEIKDSAGLQATEDVPTPTESKEKVDAGEPSKDTGEKDEIESERFLRLAAEFDNYKKRTAREFGEIVRTANTRLLRLLIEIVDNFERALSHDVDGHDGEAYRKGIELIYNQLTELLSRENVTPIASVGQPFDPNCHEAMMQAESEEFDEGVVSQEIQKGYKIDDRVLRHARVVVSRGRPQEQNEGDN